MSVKKYVSVKKYARQHPKRFATMVFLLISMAILHMFSVWQLDKV